MKRLRAAVEQNEAEDSWLDGLLAQAEDCEQAFLKAESAKKSDPSDTQVAPYCQASNDRDQHARELRRCQGLAQPGIVARKVERLRGPLAAALTAFIAEVEANRARAMIQRLNEPLPLDGGATLLSAAGTWCTKILA